MGYIDLHIVDTDINYLESLSNYLIFKHNDKFNVSVYNGDIIEVIDKLHKNDIEILLVSSEYSSYLNEVNSKSIILLNDSTHNKNGNYSSIYKYQTGEEIASDILDIYVSNGKTYCESIKTHKNECITIGVCSVAGGVGKTTISYLLARNLTEKGYKTAILPMEENQSGGCFINNLGKRNLTGIALSIFENEDIFKYKINAAITIDDIGITSLRKPESIFDMEEIENNGTIKLFTAYKETVNPQILLVDFDTGFNKKNRILIDECSVLLLVHRNGRCENEKIINLQKSLKGCENGKEILNKLIMVMNNVKESDQLLNNQIVDDLTVIAKIPNCHLPLQISNINAIMQSQQSFYNEIKKVGDYIARKF
jgi:CO dehydrogenase nickel-insertion accessory protein CooC1